jgi:AraC-like DNA-binding protein
MGPAGATVPAFRRPPDAGDGDLARIAHDVGYADQAHLTRECGELAGLPPTALARARGVPRGTVS